jgi:hypothetical protein
MLHRLKYINRYGIKLILSLHHFKMADFFLCDTTVKSISILISKGILKNDGNICDERECCTPLKLRSILSDLCCTLLSCAPSFISNAAHLKLHCTLNFTTSVVDPDSELFAGSGLRSGINHFGSGSGHSGSGMNLIPNFSVKK